MNKNNFKDTGKEENDIMQRINECYNQFGERVEEISEDVVECVENCYVDDREDKGLKEMNFFDALKEMDYGQVMIQTNSIKQPKDKKLYYSEVGTTLKWDRGLSGGLVYCDTGELVTIAKPLNGGTTKWVVKNVDEM